MTAFLILTKWLLQTTTPLPPTPTPAASFWDANGVNLIVGLLAGGLITMLLQVFGKWLWRKLKAAFEAAGFGYEHRYLEALVKQHQYLKLIGIYDKAALNPPRLKTVFISLRMASAAASENDPRFAWDRLFAQECQPVVILGQPGAGKTTLLDYLVLIFSGQITHPLRKTLGAPLPLYARLRDLNPPQGPRALLDVLQSSDSTGSGSPPPAGFFERRLRHKQCIVLLDGLDEVLDPAAHDRAVAEIQRFAADYPGNRLLVTCRVAGWKNQLPGFCVYEVQDFDRDDIQHFIANWYSEVLRAQHVNALGPKPALVDQQKAEADAAVEARQEASALWNALRQNEGLLRIARTPLILSLITLVHKTHHDLPTGRARLYGECLEVLLEKWDSEEHRLKIPNSPALDDKLAALKAIALHYLTEAVLDMEAVGLQALVAPLLPSFSVQVTPQAFIEQIIQRSGVLVEQAIGRYGFAHRALHDYLSACAIVDQNKDTLLLDHAAEERWREVILIAIRLVKTQLRAEALLQSLLDQSGENPANLALAGWSLAEGVAVRPPLRAAVRTRLLARLNQAPTTSDLNLLTGALLSIDPDAAGDWMKRALTGGDAQLGRRVLELLPELNTQAASVFIPQVARLLNTPNEDLAMRTAAALALARFDPEIANEDVWQALQTARQPQNDSSLKAAAAWAWCELGRFAELGLVKVPAGEFLMGSDKTKDADVGAFDRELPQHSLYLQAFYIARYPVTVQEWRTYCQASGHEPRRMESLQGPENHPVGWVSWDEALEYAQWGGFILPSEAEWEKAARGVDGRIYPWGNTWQAGRANTAEFWGTRPAGWLQRLFRRDINGSTTPVGQFSPVADSPYQCADMAGNIWEWTRSIPKDYPYDPSDGREDLQSQGIRVLRGGSFRGIHRGARCAFSTWSSPDLWGDTYGFRVGVASPIFTPDL